MQKEASPRPRPAIVTWFATLVRGPLEPSGDYFERLQRDIAASAPLRKCVTC